MSQDSRGDAVKQCDYRSLFVICYFLIMDFSKMACRWTWQLCHYAITCVHTLIRLYLVTVIDQVRKGWTYGKTDCCLLVVEPMERWHLELWSGRVLCVCTVSKKMTQEQISCGSNISSRQGREINIKKQVTWHCEKCMPKWNHSPLSISSLPPTFSMIQRYISQHVLTQLET